MPSWIDATVDPQVLVVLGVLLFLLWGAVKIWKPLAAFVRFMDEVIGRPGRPGLLQRMAALEEKVETIHAEVTPNHGGSMKDALRRVEEGIEDAREAHERDAARLAEHLKDAERDSKRLAEVAEVVEDLAGDEEEEAT